LIEKPEPDEAPSDLAMLADNFKLHHIKPLIRFHQEKGRNQPLIDSNLLNKVRKFMQVNFKGRIIE
jgi:UTP-glucose-1-phosphate uridylyltransferase